MDTSVIHAPIPDSPFLVQLVIVIASGIVAVVAGVVAGLVPFSSATLRWLHVAVCVVGSATVIGTLVYSAVTDTSADYPPLKAAAEKAWPAETTGPGTRPWTVGTASGTYDIVHTSGPNCTLYVEAVDTTATMYLKCGDLAVPPARD